MASVIQKVSGVANVSPGTPIVIPITVGGAGNSLVLVVAGRGSMADVVPTDSSGAVGWAKADDGTRQAYYTFTGLVTVGVGVYWLPTTGATGARNISWAGSADRNGYALYEVSTLSAVDIVENENHVNGNPTGIGAGITTTNALDTLFAVLSLGAYTGSPNTHITDPPGGSGTWVSDLINQNSSTQLGVSIASQDVTTTGAKSATWAFDADGISNDAEAIIVSFVQSPAPVITAQPADQNVNNGATATFSVTATGATGYQWQDNSGGSMANISGATSSSYAPTAAYSMQGRLYQCVVSNGSGSVTSATAKLTVAYNLTGTGPRGYPFFGNGPFGAGPFGVYLRGTSSGSTAYTLDAAAASFAVSPSAVAVSANRPVTAAPASYAVTPAAVQTLVARNLSAAAASYAVSSQPVTFSGAFSLLVSPASYAVSPAAVSAAVALTLGASPVSYAVTPSAVAFQSSWGLLVAPAAYAVTPPAVGLSAALNLGASPTSYGVTPTGVGSPADRPVTAAPGAYAVTSAAAQLLLARALTAAPASYAVSAQAVGFLVERILSVGPASYAVTAQDVLLSVTTAGAFSIDPQTYVVTAFPVTMQVQRSLGASPASYAVTASAVAFQRGLGLPVSPAGYSVTAAPVTASRAVQITAAPAGYAVTASPAGNQLARVIGVAPAAYGVTPSGVMPGGQTSFAVQPQAYAITVMDVSMDIGQTAFGLSDRVVTIAPEQRFIDISPELRFIVLAREDRFIPPI